MPCRRRGTGELFGAKRADRIPGVRQRLATIAIVAACAGAAVLPPIPVTAQDATDQAAPAATQPQAAPHRASPRRPARQLLTPSAQLPVPPVFIPPPEGQPAPPAVAAPAPPPAAAPAPPVMAPATPPIAPARAASAQEAPPAAAAPPAVRPQAVLPGPLTVAFRPGDGTLPGAARTLLENFARAAPPDDSNARLTVIGYGDDPDGDVSRARRLALARAIEVRHVLVEAGIRSTRIDVRALGRPGDGSSPDRVDVSVNAGARQATPATAAGAAPQ